MYALAFQKVILEAILDIFYFPIWWYSFGLLGSARWCFRVFQEGNYALAPLVWLRNIFVPMYGQYDIEGRIISFFMRLFQIIVRGAALLVWSIICIIFFVVYLLMPVLIIYGFYNTYSGNILWMQIK